MISVNVKKQSNYPVDVPEIKQKLKTFLESKGIVSDAEVSVAIIGEKSMTDISRKFLKDETPHNVLSFTEEDSQKGFVYPPDGVIRLGEIVVCYPLALREAQMEGKLIDDKVMELVEHGALHLLGVHHE